MFILVGIVTYNFFIEFAINIVLAPAIHRIVLVVEKQVGAKKGAHKAENAEGEQQAGQDCPQTEKIS